MTTTMTTKKTACKTTCFPTTEALIPRARQENFFLENKKGLYYTRLEVPLCFCENDESPHPQNKRRRQRCCCCCCCCWMTITIGDVLAVAFGDSGTAATPPISNSNNPFEKPWAPGQVISLYLSTGGTYKMTIRWLTWNHQNDNEDDDNDDWDVVEHYSKSTLPISSQTIVGRITLRYNSAATGPWNNNDDDDSDGELPHLTLRCNYFRESKKSGLVPISLVDSNVMERALNVLGDSFLKEQTMNALDSIQNNESNVKESHEIHNEDESLLLLVDSIDDSQVASGEDDDHDDELQVVDSDDHDDGQGGHSDSEDSQSVQVVHVYDESQLVDIDSESSVDKNMQSIEDKLLQGQHSNNDKDYQSLQIVHLHNEEQVVLSDEEDEAELDDDEIEIHKDEDESGDDKDLSDDQVKGAGRNEEDDLSFHSFEDDPSVSTDCDDVILQTGDQSDDESQVSQSDDNETNASLSFHHNTDASTISSVTTISQAAENIIYNCQEDDNLFFFSCLQVKPRQDYYAKGLNDARSEWTVRVGDLVALHHADSTKPTKKSNPWYPFTTRWSPAQVLALSYDEESGEYEAHVRWFYRFADFSENIQRALKKDQRTKYASNIVYEYNDVEAMPLKYILGRVVLTNRASPKLFGQVLDDEGIPQAPLICRTTVNGDEEDCGELTPVNDWTKTSTSNLEQLRRGLVLLKDKSLKQATLSLFHEYASGSSDDPEAGAMAVDEDGSNDDSEADAMAVDEESETEEAAAPQSTSKPSPLQARTVVSADDGHTVDSKSPDESAITSREGQDIRPFCQPKMRRGFVGDDENETADFGYTCDEDLPSEELDGRPSSQLIGNSRLNHDEGIDDEFGALGDDDTAIGTSSPSSETATTNDLECRPNSKRSRRSLRLKRSSPTDEDHRRAKSARREDEELLGGAFKQFIEVNEGSRAKDASSPSDRTTSSKVESVVTADSTKSRVCLRTRPFHQDLSTLRSYYNEIHVKPPYQNYEDNFRQETLESGDFAWTVKIGDVVIVHYQKGGRTDRRIKVPGAFAEVVAIWKTHKSRNAMKKAKRCHVDSVDADITMEIRWFYRKDELPGASAPVSKCNFTHEEIIETDFIDECEATSLLAPAILHEPGATIAPSKTLLGMPLFEAYCSRFWSIHRKALLPVGGLAGRVRRGRLHSNYVVKGGALSSALGLFENGEPPSVKEETQKKGAEEETCKWRKSFKDAIEKLGLSDASKDASVRGVRLTGREKEQDQIMTFLRARICGVPVKEDEESDEDIDHNAQNASLFVAGPPGTGKTASVLSAVARLRLEQAKGKIPAFQFVSLNGMEMQHPSEAYVKFWEVLSGHAKEKLAPDRAAVRLERYFAGRRGDDDETDQKVVVLLLDEIDYLVTKKQTVLYNFFDWPVRSCGNGNGPRLVVIGISNTMNLPSRLKRSVQSRLGGATCGFGAYNVQDTISILNSKICSNKSNSYKVFEDDAIQFAAKKAALLSGDIRKAFHICKSAAESVMQQAEAGTRVDPKAGNGAPVVRISDVQKASRESFTSVQSMAVPMTTSLQALLLVSLASLSRTTGRMDGGFDINELITKMEAISGSSGEPQYAPPPTFSETLDMLTRLGESRLVSLHTPKSFYTTFRAAQGGSGGAWPLIDLPMDSGIILRAFRGTAHAGIAEKHLGRMY